MKRKIGFLLVMLLVLVGCSGKTMVESDLGIDGAPDWVNEGTQILNDKGGRYFHGVGQAPPMGDDSLQISTADNRARAEVARILTSYMEVVQTDYSAAAGATAELVTEQSISRQIESLSKTNMSGVEIIAHWRDEKKGKIYSIAELDLEQVKKVIAANEEMNSGFGNFFESKGDNLFDWKEGMK